MIYPIPYTDRHTANQIHLAPQLHEGLPPERNCDRFCDWMLAFKQRLPRVLYFLALPLVMLILVGCFLDQEFERWIDNLDCKGVERVIGFVCKWLFGMIALLLAFDFFSALDNGAFDWLVR